MPSNTHTCVWICTHAHVYTRMMGSKSHEHSCPAARQCFRCRYHWHARVLLRSHQTPPIQKAMGVCRRMRNRFVCRATHRRISPTDKKWTLLAKSRLKVEPAQNRKNISVIRKTNKKKKRKNKQPMKKKKKKIRTIINMSQLHSPFLSFVFLSGKVWEDGIMY